VRRVVAARPEWGSLAYIVCGITAFSNTLRTRASRIRSYPIRRQKNLFHQLGCFATAFDYPDGRAAPFGQAEGLAPTLNLPEVVGLSGFMAGAADHTISAPDPSMAQMSAAAARYDRMQDLPTVPIRVD
jgi:hypothetical protein